MKCIIVVCIALAMFGMIGCYSFTGASVPPHLKTIAIPLFDDQSGTGEPNLREQFTNKIQEAFIKDGSFQLTDRRSSDALLEGTITTLSDEPSILVKGETLTKRRVTVNVRAIYRDQKLKKQMWDKQFSRFGEYEISGGPTAKQAAITSALNQLTDDILLETVSGW